jgi:hypothetical protein
MLSAPYSLQSLTKSYLHPPTPFLELFADELAIALLGKYGTGEYSMKGSFRANLETGEIIDEQEQ